MAAAVNSRAAAVRLRAPAALRTAVLAALCAGPLTGCTLPVALPPGGPGTAAVEGASCAASVGQQVLDRINAIRQDHGLKPLAPEAHLVDAAVRHSGDQAKRGEISHIGSDGSAPGDRAVAAGYEWGLVAENVAGGMPTAAAVVAGWMGSPSHRATILSADAVHAGVGHVERRTGRLTHFWTLVVAAPREGAATRVVTCHP